MTVSNFWILIILMIFLNACSQKKIQLAEPNPNKPHLEKLVQNSTSKQATSNELIEKGFSAIKSGKNLEAINFFEEARSITPNNARIFLGIGEAYREKGFLKNALKSFNQARDLNRGIPELHLAYAKTFSSFAERSISDTYRHKYNQLALKALDKAVQLKSSFGEAYFWRSEIFKSEKKYDLAQKNFQMYLQHGDTIPEDYIRLAEYALLNGNYEESRQILESHFEEFKSFENQFLGYYYQSITQKLLQQNTSETEANLKALLQESFIVEHRHLSRSDFKADQLSNEEKNYIENLHDLTHKHQESLEFTKIKEEAQPASMNIVFGILALELTTSSYEPRLFLAVSTSGTTTYSAMYLFQMNEYLKIEAAQGGGDHIAALGKLMGCSTQGKNELKTLLQSHHKTLFMQDKATFVVRFEQVLENYPSLYKNCATLPISTILTVEQNFLI